MKLPDAKANLPMWSRLLLLALLLFLCHDVTGQYRRSRQPPRQRRLADAPGPNMCKVLHVYHSRDKFFTHCLANNVKMICENPTYERWECCSGFQRKRGVAGCPLEKPLDNILETARDVKASQFISYARAANVTNTLTKRGAMTVFMPNNQAFSEMTRDRWSLINPKDGSLSLLNYHIAPGRIPLENFKERDGTFVTFYNGAKVRVNKYSYGVATVNCARIVRPDEKATNGIVHVIDKVISPWDMDSSLAEKLQSDGRFTQFQMALLVSDMAKQLGSDKHSYTVLAPTNKAFSKLPSDILDKVLTDADTAEKVIKRHVVKGVYCADAIVVAVGLKTLDNARLLFRCKRDGMWINEAKVADSDIVASNGVLHTIDTVFVPDKVKSPTQVLHDRGNDDFLDFLPGSEEILNQDNITVLVPSHDDLKKLSGRYANATQRNPLFKNHVIRGSRHPDEMVDGEALDTLNIGMKIKVQVTRKGVAVNGKMLKNQKPIDCRNNATILEVDGVLTPAENSLMDEIMDDPELSEFAKMMHDSGVPELLLPDGQYTVIAPTNRAFSMLQTRQLDAIRGSPYRLKKFMQRHVSQRMVSKCIVPVNGIYTVRSLQYDKIDFAYGSLMNLYVSKHAKVLGEDIMTSNGVLYKVDHVLPCSCERTLLTNHGRYISSYSYRRRYR